MFLTISFTSYSQDVKSAYTLYNAKGEQVAYSKLLKSASKSDFVFFGELHNNPISHWLEFEIISDLSKKKDLILSAEMFEADNQAVLNQYLKGEIPQEAFDTLARFWKNYKTDYRPLVEFAKENNLPFIAANTPRQFANLVYHGGFEALDSLTTKEKSWVAPLPIAFDSTINCYAEITKMAHGHGGGGGNLAKAQALKDATMAYFILQNYKKGKTLVHYNGSYHSDFHEGIVWWLKKEGLRSITTITTVLQKDLSLLSQENLDKADFIICVDEDMTTTY